MRRTAKAAIAAMLLTAALLAPRGVVAQPVGDPTKMPLGPGQLLRTTVGELFNRLDANNDNRLNADELTIHMRATFGRIDIDHDGYISRTELEHSVALDSTRAARGEVIADRLITTVDDFIVDVYHNGELVPESKRSLVVEVHGATVEKIEIEVRQGDWLVFHVVNNRLRWQGARYFAVEGFKQGARTGLVSDLTTGRWCHCDDPSQSAAFIADPRFLNDQSVNVIRKRWEQGDALMKQHADGSRATPIWGESHNTWLRFEAR